MSVENRNQSQVQEEHPYQSQPHERRHQLKTLFAPSVPVEVEAEVEAAPIDQTETKGLAPADGGPTKVRPSMVASGLQPQNRVVTLYEEPNQEAAAPALVKSMPTPTSAPVAVGDRPTTDQVLPLVGMAGGLLAFKGQKYSSLFKMAGYNSNLMSAGEKNGNIRRMAALYNSLTNPVANYCLIKPKTVRPFIARLDRKRKALDPAETAFREQYWVMRDELEKKERLGAFTEREYWGSVAANAADLKALAKTINTLGRTEPENEGDEPGKRRRKNLLRYVYEQFLIYFLGRDPQAVAIAAATTGGSTLNTSNHQSTKNRKNKRAKALALKASQSQTHSQPNTNVPPGLEDTVGFKTQSLADAYTLNGMRSVRTGDLDNVVMLLEQFNSRLTPDEISALTKALTEPHGVNTTLPESLSPLNLLARADFREYPDCLRVGQDWISSVVVTEYPRNFRFAQLANLIRFRDVRMAVATHYNPMTVKEAESKLRNKQGLLIGSQAESKSQVSNMDALYQIDSIKQLRALLASGDARIFQVMLVVSVRATSKARMKDDLRRVEQRLKDMNFETMLPTRNQRRAWLSSIPLGVNFLAGDKLLADRIMHPNMTGEGAAALMSNCVADFVQPGGIPLGINKNDGGMIVYNRWLPGSANPHTVIIATTGGGKTVTQMLEMLEEFQKQPDMEGYIFDIQNVLGPFARQVNGRVVDLSLAAGECVNPMDRFVSLGRPESIGERLSFLYALFALMIKQDLQGPERNAVGRAVKRLYHHFEEGESAFSTVYKHFASNPFFGALQPYLLDYRERDETGQETGPVLPGIMSRLKRIWAYLIEKHRVPTGGLVEGYTDRRTGEFRRPICRLYDGRWWYCGEGETSEPYVEPEEISGIAPGKTRPAGVWYPHLEWWQPLIEEYEELVTSEGLFDALDDTAFAPALRDAALELKRGQPLLEDLMPYLVAEGALPLADSLESFCDEERFGPVFNHYTTIDLDSRFISWNLKDLDDYLRPIRMFQIVNLIWARVRAYRRRRMLCMDEFQTMVQNFRDVGTFTRDMFQRGRYFRLAMTAIVQNAAALISYPEARLCVQNADRKVFLKQDEAAIGDLLSLYPNLTDGATDILIGATQGEGIIKVGNHNWTRIQYELTPYHLASWNTNTDQEGQEEQIDEQESKSGELWRFAFESALEADRVAAQAEQAAHNDLVGTGSTGRSAGRSAGR